MKHYQVHFQPDDKKVTIHHGATLLEAAGLVGIILTTPCGGMGRCRKCRVQLLPSQKDVLACQFRIEHDLEVFIPDSSRFFKQKILEHAISREVDSDPAIQKIFIAQSPSGGQQLCEHISGIIQAPCIIDDASANGIQEKLAANSGNSTTAVIACRQDANAIQWSVMDVEKGDTTGTLFGIAVDIGTTTIVARLIELQKGQIAATVSTGNPQTQYGADVISRIAHAETDQGLDTLNRSIVSCLNNLIQQASQKADIQPNDIYELTVAGNTTMNHLLLKYPLRQLGQAPYKAHCLEASDQRPGDIGLQINPGGNIHTLPNISGFVGSDTVAAALACGMDITETATLLVDIGTNGEIVYGAKDSLVAASCAAGPALEGAGIEFGSRAQTGAIERVVLEENDIDVDVIDQAEAATICGSGLIDAVAVMLDLGLIEPTGRFTEPYEHDPMMSAKIKRRLVTYQDAPAFVLSGKHNNSTWNNAVMITQKDIRQIQLAKAAIRAGISLLLRKTDHQESQIQQILLAGAFGNYIQRENALRIGLLPKVLVEKIHFVGNAAGTGAQMVLVSRSARNLAKKLARKIEYLEIAHQSEFQMVFSECLIFPEK